MKGTSRNKVQKDRYRLIVPDDLDLSEEDDDTDVSTEGDDDKMLPNEMDKVKIKFKAYCLKF